MSVHRQILVNGWGGDACCFFTSPAGCSIISVRKANIRQENNKWKL
jgi:hypothetical protein